MSAQKREEMNYNSAEFDTMHRQLKEAVLNMQNELQDYSAKLEELNALIRLFEARKDSMDGVVYNEAQLKELRQLTDRAKALGARRSKAAADLATPDNAAVSAKKKKSDKKTLVGNLVFYGLLALFMLAVFIVSMGGGNGVKTFMGRSAFIVKTSSMESVYPKGSLVVTRSVDPDILQVGDDITYMANQTSTITHRIIAIYENYGDTKFRGFETQGVMNDEPDKNIVLETNVVGKVVFSSKLLGSAANFIINNWPILLFSVAVLVGLSMVLENIMKDDDSGKKDGKGDRGSPGSKKKKKKKAAKKKKKPSNDFLLD